MSATFRQDVLSITHSAVSGSASGLPGGGRGAHQEADIDGGR